MPPQVCTTRIKRRFLIALFFAIACLGGACKDSSSHDGSQSSKHATSTQDETAGGDGGSDTNDESPVYTGEAWEDVTAAIEDQAYLFSGGLTVEIATTAGVVYSQSFGGFSNTERVNIASASKWVSATALLRLVEQGVLSLDEKMSGVLQDRDGNYWAGHMGDITLRHLLSLTSGIFGEDLDLIKRSDLAGITLEEAVYRIYTEQDKALTTQTPGSYFFYGDTHYRIAARYAEVKTGKSWARIYDEQIRNPLGWSSESIYMKDDSTTNPDPGADLNITGLEYMNFMIMQLRHGLTGKTRLLSENMILDQWTDQFLPTTCLLFSILDTSYHFGLGAWIGYETTSDEVSQVSNIGAYGWAAWIDLENDYATLIMTRQPLPVDYLKSECLKKSLSSLIPEALAQNPPVIRTAP